MIVTAFAASAHAGPDRVSILIGSHHVAATDRFEEINPGLFLTWEDRGGLDWSAGVYHNSYGRTSVAATAALPLNRGGKVEFSLFAGAALYPEDGRRFRYHAGDVVPVFGLQVRAGPVFAQVIPSDGKATAAIISFGLTFPLK